MIKYTWDSLGTASEARSYTCGHCGNPLASERGYQGRRADTGVLNMRIFICHFCTRPTFFDEQDGKQWPGSSYGNPVEHIDDEKILNLYDEARRCTSSSSYTAAVMCCRKLLMHVAVSKGAEENKKFAYYVDYLADNNHIPAGSKDWVKHIKDKGNEANHEIKLMDQTDAEEIISFVEMLLKVIYEFPARMKKKASPADSDAKSVKPQASVENA